MSQREMTWKCRKCGEEGSECGGPSMTITTVCPICGNQDLSVTIVGRRTLAGAYSHPKHQPS